jgi:hypothetical protein
MMAVKNRRDGVLTVKDGAANSQVVTFMESDFTYNEPVEGDPIPIIDRQGYLDHLKLGDPFDGWGQVSFSLKYVNKTIRNALVSPATTTAVTNDQIPSVYKCVNLEFVLYDEAGSPEEKHTLFNVWFNPGNVRYSEGDEYSTLSATGTIFGKYDATAENDRRFVLVEDVST